MDRTNSTCNHVHATNVLTEFMEKDNLCDIWRVLHPNDRRYTWHHWSSHCQAASWIDMFLSIDMEKCFDGLQHTAIFESLEYFNFGQNFIKWISLFYNDLQICTQNFGFLSKFWTK